MASDERATKSDDTRMMVRFLAAAVVASLALAAGCGSSSKGFGSGGGDSTGAVLTSSSGFDQASSPSSSVAVVSSTATSSVVGSSVSTVASSTTGGGCMGLGDPCSDCIFQNCQQQYCACAADTTCQNLVTCTQGCGANNANCTQGCFTNNEPAIAQGALLDDCAANACNSMCNNSLTALTACEKCLFTSCSQQIDTCLANPDCNQLVQCAEACNGDLLCEGDCENQYPNGSDDANNLSDCQMNSCGQC